MTDISNLKVYACILFTGDSDGNPVPGTERELCLLFNRTQITEKEIDELLDNNTWESDNRVTPITRARLKMLQDKKEN